MNSVARPESLPIDALDAYYLAMLRTGNPEHEQPYLYGVQNPVLYTDPLGLLSPASLATVGGGCAAADGPLPIGDVIGAPLVAAAIVWWATDVVTDWWDNAKNCERCDDDPPGICEEILRVDQETCPAAWLRRSARGYQACMSQAMNRYSECLRFGAPRSPLSPLPF